MSTIIERAEAEAILMAVPGVTRMPRIYDAGPFYAITWRDAAGFLAQVPEPGLPWTKEVYDCDKRVRWFAAHLNNIWAKTGAKLPLLSGAIFGDVPKDGDNYFPGRHALAWIIDEDRRFWLYGTYERSFMNQGAVKEIRSVYDTVAGG